MQPLHNDYDNNDAASTPLASVPMGGTEGATTLDMEGGVEGDVGGGVEGGLEGGLEGDMEGDMEGDVEEDVEGEVEEEEGTKGWEGGRPQALEQPVVVPRVNMGPPDALHTPTEVSMHDQPWARPMVGWGLAQGPDGKGVPLMALAPLPGS